MPSCEGVMRVSPSFIQSRRVTSAHAIKETESTRRPLLQVTCWICLALACVGASWFAFQCFLVPQPRSYIPDWQGARWIQAADAAAPVAYFRLSTTFEQVPDEAFITVTANQVFDVYVNGYMIGTNAGDFVQGKIPRTYMYDISMALRLGVNVIGLRVTNLDNQLPQVRASIGTAWGQTIHTIGSDANWQATAQSSLVYPRQAGNTRNAWARPGFSALLWPPARLASAYPPDAPLLVDPAIYEQPMPSYWLNAGSGPESYYVHQFALSPGYERVLLRILAMGKTDIFINGHLAMQWNSQVEVRPQQNYAGYEQDDDLLPLYQKGLMLGVYDITPYVHAGTNMLAIHVSAPGYSAAQVGLETYQGSLSADLLVMSGRRQTSLLDAPDGWYAARRPVANWVQGGSATATWSQPVSIGRPGSSQVFYLSDVTTPLNSQYIDIALWLPVVGGSVLGILACWLVMGLLVLRRYYALRREALMAAVLSFLPALACEALLIVLSREPSIPLPFPYTAFWGCFLVALVVLSAFFCWWRIRALYHLRRMMRNMQMMYTLTVHECEPAHTSEPARGVLPTRAPRSWIGRSLLMLKRHWALLPLILLAIPMICYNIGYEPYWQDELASYEAARGILAHGIPIFPSGVLYPKAELFSYMMALMIAVLGAGQIVPRLISVAEYLLCIPLLYFVGFSLFKKRSIAWLATALLALSPYALLWGKQARMYEQALFMVTLTMYLFYRAMQARRRARPIYLAVLCLAATYLSHEESFIILPAVLFYALLGSREGPYGIPAVLREKHWWLAAIIGGGIIGAQLSIVHFFHPILLGTDQSVRPEIQLTTNNVSYYFRLLFLPLPVRDEAVPWRDNQPWLILNSILAITGIVWACFSRDRAARYCAFLLVVSLFTLTFLFTMQADRYLYPLFSVFYLLDAYALYKILRSLWLLARPHLVMSRSLRAVLENSSKHLTDRFAWPLWIVSRSIVLCLCLCVILLPVLPLNSYNLFVSRALGLAYHRHYSDFDNAAAYVHSHWQPGDVVIAAVPAVSVLYYVGQADDYFSVDRALFVTEQDGFLHETTSNSHPILNRADFQAILSAHKRVWIISDNGSYEAEVVRNNRFGFPPADFHKVYEGYGSDVYFRGD
jgi:4-amino-4-deoxy-L-arabinose transferase-like glycosyltransferase